MKPGFTSFLVLIACYSFGQPNIIITGKATNTNFKVITLRFITNALLDKETRRNFPINADGTFKIQYSNDKAHEALLINNKIFVTPGDSIHVEIFGSGTMPKMTFTGRNAGNYQFSSLYRDTLNALSKKFHLGDSSLSMNAFINNSNKVHELLKNYVRTYTKAAKSETSFTNYANSENLFNHYFNLLAYLSGTSDPAKARKLLSKAIDKKKLMDEGVLQSRQGSLTLWYYNMYYLNNVKDDILTDSAALRLYNSAINDFTGPSRPYLIKEVMKYYVRRGYFIYNTALATIYGKIKDAEYPAEFKNHIASMYEQYDILKKSLPPEILALDLISSDGQELKLGTVLKNFLGQTLYVDFWASWCIPCIQEFPYSRKISGDIKNVEFVYISLDKDYQAWQNSIKKLQLNEKSYWLKNDFSSPLVKYLGFTSIPFYLIINSKSQIEQSNSFRPSDPKLMSLLESLTEKSIE